MTKEEQVKLMKFLSDCDLLRVFEMNLKSISKLDFESYCSSVDKTCAISGAFPFKETVQGSGFWNGIDDRWKNKIRFHA